MRGGARWLKAGVILAVMLLSHSPRAALTIGPWIPKFKGVDYSVSTNIPPSGGTFARRQVVHAFRVDLNDPDVEFFPTPRIASGYTVNSREVASYTVSDFLRINRLQAAINANFFSSPGYYPPAGTPMDVYGLQICRGVIVSPAQNRLHAATILLDENNRPTVIHTNWPAASTEGIYTAVTGNYPLVVAGRNIGPKGDVEPRTVFGISQDRRYMYLIGIDGRQPGYSDGATDFESGAWLLQLGAYDGVNMDGGGSTTLVVQNSTGAPQRLNRPSAVADSGRERTVGSHLGIYAKPLPGFINDVNAAPDDTTAAITWTTLEPSTSQVEYGPTTNFGSKTPVDPLNVTNHSVNLSGLTPNTGYYYRVISSAAGTAYVSAIFFFTTRNNVTTNEVFGITHAWKFSEVARSGIEWTSREYDDTAWTGEGPGLLWVDNRTTGPNPAVEPKNTQMPSNPDYGGDPYVTYYFRTHVDLPALAPGSSLWFSGYIDDGAVFYLNGAEIYRLRVPAGATALTVANGYPCAGDATCLDEFAIPISSLPSLRAGDNVLAAEVHNYNVRSADITFGLSLGLIEPLNRPIKLELSVSGQNVTLSWSASGMVLQTAPSLDGPWTDVQGSQGSPVTIRASETVGFFRLRRQDGIAF